jgi:uncharacterized protein (DUF1330 family)
MSVYVIAQLKFKDLPRYRRYQSRFMEVLQQFKGVLLVADEKPQPLEGNWSFDKIVVIAFPDDAACRNWSESPQYREISKDRRAGADAVVVLSRGVP